MIQKLDTEKGTAGKPARREESDREESLEISDTVLDHGSNLLIRSRAAWEIGDWPALARLAEQPLEDYEDRAKLALLAAVGLAQLGDLDEAGRYARMAQGWGCPARLIARVLIGGVWNSLGRAASLHGEMEKARGFFEQSVRTVNPRVDAAILGRARDINEKAALGQLPEATKLMGEDIETLRREMAHRQTADLAAKLSAIESRLAQLGAASGPQTPRDEYAASFSRENAAAFEAAMADWCPDRDFPALLEVKSLPRSGIHYMKSSLAHALNDRFSFCEWYFEPGCCRKVPCSVARAALDAADGGALPLRMIKSHDFNLSNPNEPPPPGVMRLALVRDPLMVLTSWWLLEEINRHADLLRAAGIRPERIFYLHEKPVLAQAYKILAAQFRSVPRGRIDKWLTEKTSYISAFLDKWGTSPSTRLVLYEDIPEFLRALLSRPCPGLSEERHKGETARLERFLENFIPRSEPFSAPVPQVAETLKRYEEQFLAAAEKLRKQDKTGVL